MTVDCLGSWTRRGQEEDKKRTTTGQQIRQGHPKGRATTRWWRKDTRRGGRKCRIQWISKPRSNATPVSAWRMLGKTTRKGLEEKDYKKILFDFNSLLLEVQKKWANPWERNWGRNWETEKQWETNSETNWENQSQQKIDRLPFSRSSLMLLFLHSSVVIVSFSWLWCSWLQFHFLSKQLQAVKISWLSTKWHCSSCHCITFLSSLRLMVMNDSRECQSLFCLNCLLEVNLSGRTNASGKR